MINKHSWLHRLDSDIGCDLSVALKLWVIQPLHFETVLQKQVLLNELKNIINEFVNAIVLTEFHKS